MNRPDRFSDDDFDALFARARARRTDTAAVELAFETRLLARLRAERVENISIWAVMAWRFVPFLAVAVAALALWQTEFIADSTDTAAFAGLENPEAVDFWNNAN